jgi:phosphatidylglycerophosphatase A
MPDTATKAPAVQRHPRHAATTSGTDGSVPHKNASRAPLAPLSFPVLMLSTGGLGFLRPAPGSWGSLPPVALVWALLLIDTPTGTIRFVLCAVIAVFSLACIAGGRYSERRFGMKDAPEVVADETAGQAVTLLPLTWLLGTGAASHGFVTLTAGCAIAFVMFRLCDIFKAPPVRTLEKLPHGWGVLMDDLAAGLIGALGVVLIFLLAQAAGVL